MSRNYYSEINLHLTWHCKQSANAHPSGRAGNTPNYQVRQYIQNQRSHHATGKIVDRLEHITEIEAVILDRNPVNGVDTAKDGEECCSPVRQPGINAGPTTG